MPDNRTLPKPGYDLTPAEQRQFDEIKDQIAAHGTLCQTDRDGNLVLDRTGSPVPIESVILRSRRFLVDNHCVLWRYFQEGTKKDPNATDGGGAPWRNNRVEMWTGKWRRVIGPDGEATYAKVLTARPIDKRINGHPGMSQMDWYRNVKGYKHPFDPLHAPSANEIKALEGQRAVAAAEVYARMDTEFAKAGISTDEDSALEEANCDRPQTKRRTNRRATE
ncbi:MAG: hypothetical protein HQ546_01785 [Planctomycetes bacterium]|nr:hypothetical protein [Planctomycetota bacterium]